MGPILGYLSSLFVLVSSTYIEALGAMTGPGTVLTGNQVAHLHGSEPHVAFLCGKPSMHLTTKGWVPDSTQDCLDDPEQILAYCRRVYPEKAADIVNVEPAQVLIEVDNWCTFHNPDCRQSQRLHTTHRVRPYRCLVGPISTEPLEVPAHCHFAHVNYNPPNMQCELFDHWNQTAAQECDKKVDSNGLKHHLQSFGVLFPCRKDASHFAMYFSGVEFVCCPQSFNDIGHPQVAKGYIVGQEKQSEEKPVAPMLSTLEAPAIYLNYLKIVEDKEGGVSEHDRFVDARQAIRNWTRTKERQLEKELERSEANLEETWKVEPSVASGLEKENQERFRRLYMALLEEEAAFQRQLDSVHQERVSQLHETKRVQTMEVLDYALQEVNPRMNRIVQAMERLIRVIEKGKVHAINHYEHLRMTDPEEAKRQHKDLKPKLEAFDKEVDEALMKLDKVPDLKASIMSRIKEFLTQFNEVDASGKEALVAQIPQPEDKTARFQNIISKYQRVADPNVVHVAPVHDTEPEVEVDPKPEYHLSPNQHESPVAHHAFADKKSMQLASRHGGENAGHSTYLILGLCVAGIACLLVIGVGAALIHRRTSFNHSHAGYTMSVVEIDKSDPSCMSPNLSGNGSASSPIGQNRQPMGGIGSSPNQDGACSPEERHLTALQVNGYENPTYKYFEVKTVKPTTTPAAEQ